MCRVGCSIIIGRWPAYSVSPTYSQWALLPWTWLSEMNYIWDIASHLCLLTTEGSILGEDSRQAGTSYAFPELLSTYHWEKRRTIWALTAMLTPPFMGNQPTNVLAPQFRSPPVAPQGQEFPWVRWHRREIFCRYLSISVQKAIVVAWSSIIPNLPPWYPKRIRTRHWGTRPIVNWGSHLGGITIYF